MQREARVRTGYRRDRMRFLDVCDGICVLMLLGWLVVSVVKWLS